MNMRFAQFLRLDLAGAALYIITCFTVGFVFSGLPAPREFSCGMMLSKVAPGLRQTLHCLTELRRIQGSKTHARGLDGLPGHGIS